MSEWISVNLPLNKQDIDIKKSLMKEYDLKSTKRPNLFKEFKKEFNIKNLKLADLNNYDNYVIEEIKDYATTYNFCYYYNYLVDNELYFNNFENKTFQEFEKDIVFSSNFWGNLYIVSNICQIGGRTTNGSLFFEESLKDKQDFFEAIKKSYKRYLNLVKYHNFVQNHPKTKEHEANLVKRKDTFKLIKENACFYNSIYNKPGYLIDLYSEKHNKHYTFLIGSVAGLKYKFGDDSTIRVIRAKKVVSDYDLEGNLMFE